MAAPHVSGVAALVCSNIPEATVAEVREAIFLGADPVAGLQQKLATGGRLNAHGALVVDTAVPRATLVSAPDVTGPGGTEVLITVPSVVTTDDRATTDEDTPVGIDVLGNDREVARGPGR